MDLNVQFIQNNGLHLVFKTGILLVILLVFFFLVVVLNQARAMNRILTQQDLFPYLFYFALFLIAATLALFVAGVVIL